MSYLDMTPVESDRDWRIAAVRASVYWGEAWATGLDPDRDLVHVVGEGEDRLELTPTEARSLAALLIRFADEIDGDSPDSSARTSEADAVIDPEGVSA